MKHFDINVHNQTDDDSFVANVYPLVAIPGTPDFTTDTSVTLANIPLTAEQAKALGNPTDGWFETEDLPESLAEALADTIERLRA